MSTESILAVFLIIPMLGAVVSTPLRGRTGDVTPAVASALALILVIVAVLQVFPRTVVYHFGQLPWIHGAPTVFGFMLDPLSSLMLLVITTVGLLVVVYSGEYLSPRNRDHAVTHDKGDYYFWLLLFIGSMIGVVISPNLLQLFIFWEMTTICSWALISYTRETEALRAGFKAVIMTHVGSVFLMVALVMLFVATGSFDFNALDKLAPDTRTMVFALIMLAGWAKAAQFPFFTWLPDAMSAPTPISAYLHAAAMVKAGVYLVARVALSNTQLADEVGLVLAGMAMFTMLVAVTMYFFQDDLKRLLAFSTIANLSYILLGVALGVLGSKTGFEGGVLHIVNHAAGKGLLFLCVGAIAYATGTKSISELSGVGRRMPIVGISFLVGMFAIAGVPPLSCFWSKFYILTGAFELGNAAGTVLGVLIAIESLVAFAWFLHVGQKVFLGRISDKAQSVEDPPWPITVPLIVFVILCVVAPLVGWPIINAIEAGL